MDGQRCDVIIHITSFSQTGHFYSRGVGLSLSLDGVNDFIFTHKTFPLGIRLDQPIRAEQDGISQFERQALNPNLGCCLAVFVLQV